MNQVVLLSFEQPAIGSEIERLDVDELDSLEFGVIGFDSTDVVRIFNATESAAAALHVSRVIGHPLFTVVAPCMNNYMVAQQFVDAADKGRPLDAIIDYVLTLRMQPVPVKLRLLASPGIAMRYVLVKRRP